MRKYDVSILIPGIRTHLWENLYKSIEEACTKYSWELVLTGPFLPPLYLLDKDNVQFIPSYRCPSAACLYAYKYCRGEYIAHSVDDATFFPGSLDKAMYRAGDKTIVNLKYREGNNVSMPSDYWKVNYHEDLRLPGIPQNYSFAIHFLMHIRIINRLGGWSCLYQHMNLNVIDMILRAQRMDYSIIESPEDVTYCTHMPGETGDHKPIHNATLEDLILFKQKYQDKMYLERPYNVFLNLDNWKNTELIWSKRFNPFKLPTSYMETIN